MTRPRLPGVAWGRLKKYLVPVLAAALMYGGISQIISALRYPLTGLAIQLVNAVLMKGFRDGIPLNNVYVGIPWFFHVRLAAEGMFVFIVGALLALWAYARNQRQSLSQLHNG